MVFLTSWRIVPTLATIYIVVLAKQLAESTSRRMRCLIYSLALSVAGFALVWVPTFLFELHGSFQLYYQRFFGFFSKKSGWDAFAGPKFRLFPNELIKPQTWTPSVASGAHPQRTFSIAQGAHTARHLAPAAATGLLAYSYGFYVNQGGGGCSTTAPSSSPSGSLSSTLCTRRANGGRWRS